MPIAPREPFMRPPLHAGIDPDVFDAHYWYRAELLDLARALKVSPGGGKFEVHDRISHFLRTGERLRPAAAASGSSFDWQADPLSLDTVITDSYRNTQHVRAFFVEHLGPDFSFTIALMQWCREHAGATLADALDAERDRRAQVAAGQRPVIEPHNQYNRFMRDYRHHNPDSDRGEVDAAWQSLIAQARPGCRGRGFRHVADGDT